VSKGGREMGVRLFLLNIGLITRALVCRSATANHLCEEFMAYNVSTRYYKIRLQNGVLSAASALSS
jgi:hypothetical protein